MRTRILVGALLSLGGCFCWEDPIACVASRSGTPGSTAYGETCRDAGGLQCESLTSDPDAPDPGAPTDPCPGLSREGSSCDDLGFTKACSGDYFVRPGDAC